MSRPMALGLAPADDAEFGSLILTCYKCTREGRFHGLGRDECDRKAINAGWVKDGGKMICPACPAVRA